MGPRTSFVCLLVVVSLGCGRCAFVESGGEAEEGHVNWDGVGTSGSDGIADAKWHPLEPLPVVPLGTQPQQNPGSKLLKCFEGLSYK